MVDGSLAMDNAIDVQAAQTKGIASLAAGRANEPITPNLEAGDMLAKELISWRARRPPASSSAPQSSSPRSGSTRA